MRFVPYTKKKVLTPFVSPVTVPLVVVKEGEKSVETTLSVV